MKESSLTQTWLYRGKFIPKRSLASISHPGLPGGGLVVNVDNSKSAAPRPQPYMEILRIDGQCFGRTYTTGSKGMCMGMITRNIMCCIELHTNPFFRLATLWQGGDPPFTCFSCFLLQWLLMPLILIDRFADSVIQGLDFWLDLIEFSGPQQLKCFSCGTIVFWPQSLPVLPRWCLRLTLKVTATTRWPCCSVPSPTPPQPWSATCPTDTSCCANLKTTLKFQVLWRVLFPYKYLWRLLKQPYSVCAAC